EPDRLQYLRPVRRPRGRFAARAAGAGPRFSRLRQRAEVLRGGCHRPLLRGQLARQGSRRVAGPGACAGHRRRCVRPPGAGGRQPRGRSGAQRLGRHRGRWGRSRSAGTEGGRDRHQGAGAGAAAVHQAQRRAARPPGDDPGHGHAAGRLALRGRRRHRRQCEAADL
ncbi:MAG: Ribonuclease E inhibitor RraA, partial [uncultured Ramlibacter sp.]